MNRKIARVKPSRFEFMQENAVAVCYGISSLIVILLFIGTYYKCVDEKRSDIEAAFRDTANISRAVEEHAIRTFEQASLLALSIRSRYELDDKLNLGSLAKVDPNSMSIFQLLSIIDEKGINTGSSKADFTPVDLSEREHFKVHVNSTTNNLFVSKPVLGKVSGKWSIQLTTRLVKADKSFGGVVVVSLDPFYLSSFYKDIDIGPHGKIILVGHDGIIRAQKDMTADTVGKPIDDQMAGFVKNQSPNKLDNITYTEAQGQTILLSIRAVKGFPLSVIASVSESDALAGFYSRRNVYFAFAACLSVLVFFLATWTTRIFKELREGANRHRIMFDNSPLGIMHIGSDGTVINCNDKLAEQMGSTKEALLHFNVATQTDSKLQSVVKESLNGKPSFFEDIYTSATGNKTSYIRMVFNPVNPGKPPTDVIVTIEDISERMQQQEKLRVTSERLQLATEASNIGIWDYDLVHKSLIWDPMMYKLYGFENQNHAVTYKDWESRIHPDDLDASRTAIMQALNGKEDFSFEFRIFWDIDKSIHYIKASALIKRDENGNALRMVGTNLDITAMKNAESELHAAYTEIEQRVANRTQELARANELLQSEIIDRKLAHREINQILSSISSILIGVDCQGAVVRWNDAAANIFGLNAPDVIGKPLYDLPIPWDWEMIVAGVLQTRTELKPKRFYNLWYERIDGQDGFFVVTIGPLWNEEGGYDGYLILGDDISEVKFLEAQLANAAKLEAIGQLAAGIAHEINTPTQYVGDSVTFLKESFDDIGQLFTTAERYSNEPEKVGQEAALALRNLLEKIDADFLQAEIPKTIERIFDGIERISTIVQAMRRFSFAGGEEKRAFNLKNAIENTLVISRNEWKYVAEAQTDFDKDLPDILCMPGEISQVLLNIIVNAAHAIGDVVQGTSNLGLITITTKADGDFAEIRIRDTGTGIPKDVGDKVFNLFFTTKEVGKGTGQGLAIAYDIVVNKHGGTLEYESEPGAGTTFIIRLPCDG
ncbi:MAG: PAS domain S-box protein [Desulfovibrio sp.]|nr:PAS domain S-box protein [Desulfovibrio sp.]MBI4961290.1 PAS domain S-box protein [Desulfovibrio sp.]